MSKSDQEQNRLRFPGLVGHSLIREIVRAELSRGIGGTARSRCKLAWDFLKQNKGDGEKALVELKAYEKALAESEGLQKVA